MGTATSPPGPLSLATRMCDAQERGRTATSPPGTFLCREGKGGNGNLTPGPLSIVERGRIGTVTESTESTKSTLTDTPQRVDFVGNGLS